MNPITELTRRGWRGWLILGFVAVQLLAPLHYYVLREDKNDERFAWRMFSPVRMKTCKPTFLVAGQPENLYASFHEAWKEIAERGRLVVLEAMGQKLCRLHPGAEVRLDLVCTSVDGAEERLGGSNLCQFPDL